MNEIIKKFLNHRQTVKSYSDKKIGDDDFRTILETIYWSPSSLGVEPYRVLIIGKENSLRGKLTPLMWGQGVVKEADKLLLFISLKEETFKDIKWIISRTIRVVKKLKGKEGDEAKKIAEKMAKGLENNFLSNEEINDHWSMKQTYIALGMAMYSASILGIGSTPMEGFEKNKVEKLLKGENLIKDNENLSVILALGYAKDKTSYSHFGTGKRVRDKWENKFTEI